MTVKVRPYRRGGWKVAFMLTLPGRPRIRDRNNAPVTTKTAAERWGEKRERPLIQLFSNPDPSEDPDDDRPAVVEVIDKMPAKLKTLKEAPPDFEFFDFEDFDRLVLAAKRLSEPNDLLTVLLGGEPGLRCSELRPLLWSDLDLKRGRLTVGRAMWRGHEGPPKGSRPCTVPLAPRLHEALQQHRHLRAPHVLCTHGGTRTAATTARRWLVHAQQAAPLPNRGPHVRRRTLCSHLAMTRKPAKAIQELAGHQSVSTTERYMHLAPDAARDAIEALRRPPNWRPQLETAPRV